LRGTVEIPAIAIAAAIAGCGGGGGGGSPDAGVDGGESGPVDLSSATWVLEPLTASDERSTGPQLTHDTSGRALVVWEEGIRSIGFAVESEGGWDQQLITIPDNATVFGPSIAPGAGGRAHIVFTGSPEPTGPDIYYVSWDGVALSEPVNLTGPLQTVGDFDASPAVVERADGSVTVLYYMSPEDEFGVRELRRFDFTDAASAGAPAGVLPPQRNCGENRAEIDGGGALHLITKCIPDGGDFEVVYLNDRSGTLMPQIVDSGGSRNFLSPDLAISSDASRIHVVFRGTLDCGDELCNEIYYSANLNPAVAVTATPEELWDHPRVVLDRFDRPIVLFHSRDAERLHWSFPSGGRFFRAQRVDDDSGARQTFAGAATFDPATGLPVVPFERVVGEGPEDVWIARLVAN
jgi:hypothetical protein